MTEAKPHTIWARISSEDRKRLRHILADMEISQQEFVEQAIHEALEKAAAKERQE